MDDVPLTAIVSHDAGGAEILSSLVRRSEFPCKFALSGPSLPIFQKKLGGLYNQSISEAICDTGMLICGTSSPSTFELGAISLAHRLKIKAVAVLDHWINYRERFLFHDEMVLPDEIWVVDELAHKLAFRTFPGINIRLIENPYKLDILDRLSLHTSLICNAEPRVLKTALYVTEPTSEHAERKYNDKRYWGYTEHEALMYFLQTIKRVEPNISKVVVRPHPSENSSKYTFSQSIIDIQVIISKERDLIQEIAEADIVAGCNSMAMVVGMWAKKRVICFIPPGGRGYSLSGEGVEFAQNILEGRNVFKYESIV